MQWAASWLCIAAPLFLLCFAPSCPSAQKYPKCWHDRRTQIRQKQHSRKTFCDPSFSNQTAGAVTQKCSSGFYREWAGPNRGQCVPCSCNGLSDECDERTGNCVKCQFDTTGDRCERCKEGYFGDPVNRTCRACPCPFTENNFALACLDVGSGVVECLCKRGYSGVRCERCAFGYYGNPMVQGGMCKPCNCKKNGLNPCDSLTGECITSGNSNCGDHCHAECDSCTYTLLVDSEKMDDDLFWLKQQLQNISHSPVSRSTLNNLEVNISEAKVQMGRHSTAVRLLDPKVEQLEADVAADRYDLSQLSDENLDIASYLKKTLESANETKLKAEDLSKTGALLTTIQDLIKQLTEAKPEDSVSLSEKDKGRMMEEAQRIMQEMRKRGCIAQRDKAGSEQEKAHKLLELISNDMIAAAEMKQLILIQSGDSVMASDSAVRELGELLLDAEDRVDRARGLNLKSRTALQHLQHLKAQLDKEQSTLHPVTEMTKDLLKNISDILSILKEVKKEFEKQAAQLDGAKLEHFQQLNNSFIIAEVEAIAQAEEHAKELKRMATELQQVLHTATNSTSLVSLLGIGAYDSIIKAVEMAEKAAKESKRAADQTLKDVKKKGLISRSEQLKDNSTHLWRETRDTQSHLKTVSRTVNAHRNRVNKQKKKRRSLRIATSSISDKLKKIKRGDTVALIGSVKTAASDANATVSNVKERLRNISEEVGRITLTNISVNINDMLTDADQAVKSFDKAFPVMSDKLAEVKALGRKMSPHPNMTESIQRIKDIIEETRNFVNRLPLGTTFNGKSHIELHPPRNLEDIKAFTAVDLLLNRHHKTPSKSDVRRKRHQDEHRDDNLFVFYLGSKNASGDYIGMAIRNTVLVCVYKLGGVVHEVETSQITLGSVNSSDFNRVIFHRVYQDAEVNVTQNFTSKEPVSLPPKRNLPNTMTGVFDLDPGSVVFYVGGYPDYFTPPVELRYPKYRGAIKLSYLNDNPVCLFNFKHAVNMDAKQHTVKIPQDLLSDYYEGRGYRMAFIKDPDWKKRRLFRFHINSRETNALLFYIGNNESFFCVFVERGFLVLQGQQADREIRLQSPERVSLFDTQFAIAIADKFIVQYGPKTVSTDHIQTDYMSYYIGGLPAELRERHNITAAPLRGCVDHLKADAEIVEYNRTIGVSSGCPLSLLGVRAATLNSSLSVDSLFAWDEQPVRFSLGFRSTGKRGVVLKSGSQGSEPVHNLQLSLDDGFVVFHSFNYTLRSNERYSDGVWHYVSAVGKPSGLLLSIDNVNVSPAHSDQISMQRGKFKGCIANIYTSRPSILPADLSSLSQTGDIIFGQCSQPPPPHSTMKRPQTHNLIKTPAGSQCRPQRAYQLYEKDSWVSYNLPQENLNYRPHFSLDINTKSSKGLILHVAGEGAVPLLALYVANGKIKMSLGQNRIIQHKEKSNDGNWHRVEFSVENSTFHLLVDGIRVTDGRLPNNEGSSLDLHNPVYLGADTKSKNTKGPNIPTDSVISCIREFKMNDVFVGAAEVSHKALPCFDELAEEGAYFGGGHIVLDNYFTVGSHFLLSFKLRPQHLTGLLLHVQSDKTSLNVFLMENKVGVKVNDGYGAVSVSVTPRKSLCDGKFHEVTVSKKKNAIQLVVDSVSKEKAGPKSTSYSTALESLHIGGTTNQNGAPVPSPFVGCLRNVKLNGKPVAFEKASRVVGPVSINRCPAN
ncbi:laminin subunit alpha-3 isoform X2 [Oreochromis niloticus]|uniref:laminin subunit alpha-3 isoform X2 n=1 Tax=Oreochromis niloticus TaxID=8128 RepID=UPI0003945866|nr:laminin subunit alpha-3 isoform X2 [Oreochromis niloticus]